MSTPPSAFSLGSERGDDGSFKRQVSSFRAFVADEGSDFPVQSGRYHLYVARACPWAHQRRPTPVTSATERLIQAASFLRFISSPSRMAAQHVPFGQWPHKRSRIVPGSNVRANPSSESA